MLHPEASSDPNIQNPFLTHRSHAGTSRAHWVISSAPERLGAGGRSESERLYVGLAPPRQSPANHLWSQTECQHATTYISPKCLPQSFASSSCLLLPLVTFSIHCTVIVNIFTPTLTLSFAARVFWTEMELKNNLFSDDKMPKNSRRFLQFSWKTKHLL